MICIQVDISQSVCDIDDDLKAIYYSKDTVGIWTFKTWMDRKKFVDDTVGMLKFERENYYEEYFS